MTTLMYTTNQISSSPVFDLDQLLWRRKADAAGQIINRPVGEML